MPKTMFLERPRCSILGIASVPSPDGCADAHVANPSRATRTGIWRSSYSTTAGPARISSPPLSDAIRIAAAASIGKATHPIVKLTVSWASVFGATGYKVQWKWDGESGVATVTVTATDPSGSTRQQVIVVTIEPGASTWLRGWRRAVLGKRQQFPLEAQTRTAAGFRKKFFVDFPGGFGTIGPCPTDWTERWQGMRHRARN